MSTNETAVMMAPKKSLLTRLGLDRFSALYLEDRHLLELDEREVDSWRKRQYRNLGIGILDSILCIYFRPVNRCSHVALSCDHVFPI